MHFSSHTVLIKKINELKLKNNAVILAHNYQLPEVFSVADFIGDSLDLSLKAASSKADTIVFCGVYFMAESAKILNPNKTVLIPVKDSGCAMSDMITPTMLVNLKKLHPKAKVVAYINSSAEIKSLSDAICTSSNAVDVVKKMNSKEIIFVPDKNLANYVSTQLPNVSIYFMDAYCPIHNAVTSEFLQEYKSLHPTAKIIAHPESRPEILQMADYVCSTSKMLETAKTSDSTDFFVLTECGILNRLKKSLPDKTFTGVCNLCFDMKKIRLHDILESLLYNKHSVTVENNIALKARKAFGSMIPSNQ